MNYDNFSVIILVYKRYSEISKLINYYQQCTNDLIIVDNGGELDKHFSITNNFLWVRMSKNIGSTIKFKAVSLAKKPFVLITDDDIVPTGPLINDMLKSANDIPNWNILTVFGFNIDNGDYFKNARIAGFNITEPLKVDFAGQFYFGKRELFLVDLKNTHSLLDDLMLMYLQDKTFGKLNRYIFPTKNYKHSVDLNIPQAISRHGGFRRSRSVLAKAVYENNIEVIKKMLEGYYYKKDEDTEMTLDNGG